MDERAIDIVIPWVDGTDPVWQAERSKYTPGSTSDSSTARYRNWDQLHYWFRGIEQYAPWVNKVHFVTCGHLPGWLNTNHPKLHIVRHEDYIPAQYLPTFSSHVIELNMHKIPDLAEHFIYFNDDVYLTSSTRSSDFFIGGMPVDTAAFGVVKNNDKYSFMPYIMLNMLGIIITHFSKREMLRRDFFKWITPKNGGALFNNLYLLPWGVHTGFRNYHSCIPFCKSTFERVWDKEHEILDATCSHKFRCKEDVNDYLMRYWQLCEGNFVPHKPQSAYLTIGKTDAQEICRLLQSRKYKVVCINDDPGDFDYDEQKSQLDRILQAKFPQPSSFEL